MNLFTDRKYRIPRLWSNAELRKFAPLFKGSVINVSAWTDSDKENSKYRQYFKNAKSYHLSNYLPETCGLQGYPDEIFLDLTETLDSKYIEQFDAVFNHTTLEHIFDVETAFSNLCKLSRDIVIIVVPFLQPMHSSYGDYWRFTPQTLKRLFSQNNFSILYTSANNDRHSSIYLFCIAARHPTKWKSLIPYQFDFSCQPTCFSKRKSMIGCRSITNSLGYSALNTYNHLASLLRGTLKSRLR